MSERNQEQLPMTAEVLAVILAQKLAALGRAPDQLPKEDWWAVVRQVVPAYPREAFDRQWAAIMEKM